MKTNFLNKVNFDLWIDDKKYQISWICDVVNDYIFKNNKICYYDKYTPKPETICCDGEVNLYFYKLISQKYINAHGITTFCRAHKEWYNSGYNIYCFNDKSIEQLKNLLTIKDIIE